MYQTPDYIHQPLYVITTIFNPIRYKTRWKHYVRFAKHVKDSGGVLITVEAAFGDRHHALQAGETQHGTPLYGEAPTKAAEFHKARTEHHHQYIRVRTGHELWLKENLVNIGMSFLPEDWQMCAWVDADVMFARANWVGETVHQLQHYKFVQMFSEVTDLGPHYNPVSRHRGFVNCYLNGVPKPKNMPGYYYGQQFPGGPHLWHPGYAWAARRDAIDDVGGLIDFAVLGAADNHMAHALIGCAKESIHPKATKRYREKVLEWEFRCERLIRRNVGYVSGLLLHYWHGKKVDRRYWDRWKIVVDNCFDPDKDLKPDAQGAMQLVDRGDARSIALRDGIRRYFRQRNEDSNEVD